MSGHDIEITIHTDEHGRLLTLQEATDRRNDAARDDTRDDGRDDANERSE